MVIGAGHFVMDTSVAGVVIGLLCGAAVGVERQWSGHAQGPASHFAGVRTFTLLGGATSTAGFLWSHGFEMLAVALLAGVIGIIVVAYAAISRRDLDATTEMAALVVAGAGVLAGLNWWRLASAMTVLTALLLVEKSRLHTMVARISDVGIRSSFRFALMAVVILPLLPEGPFGPLGGVRPRELWLLVLLFSGLSFFAHIVRSIVGPGRGYVIAGMLGGLISSTNVALTFSRLSRRESGAGISLALGVIAACTMMYLRVSATATLLNPEFGVALVPYMIAPALLGAAFIAWGFRRTGTETQEADGTANPLQFRSALQMALLFQVVLFGVTAVRQRWGDTGILWSGLMLGLTDMDALVISMAKQARDHEQISNAAVSTVVGTLSNTAMKLGLAAAFGSDRFRALAVGGLTGLGAATVAFFLLLR